MINGAVEPMTAMNNPSFITRGSMLKSKVFYTASILQNTRNNKYFFTKHTNATKGHRQAYKFTYCSQFPLVLNDALGSC